MKGQLIACLLLLGCTPQNENLGFTPVGSTRWAVGFGSADDDGASGVAIDSIGDVVAVGHEQEGELNSVGLHATRGFVTKRTASDGSERWTVQIVPQQDLSYAGVGAVAIAADDSIFVTGSYIGTVDFGGQTLSLAEPSTPSHGDTFLAKYSWDGQLQWVKGLDPSTDSYGVALAVDSAGRILLTGVFGHGPLTFGGVTYDGDNDSDTYLIAFDPAGTVLWGTAFQGAGGPAPEDMAVAANDDICVVGGFAGPATFGGATVDSGASSRAFLTRYRKDGLFLSSQVLGVGGAGQSYANQVAVSSTGQIVVQTTEQEALDGNHPAYAAVHVFDDTAHETWSAKQADLGRFGSQMRSLATSPSGLIVSSSWDDSPAGPGSMDVVSYDPTGHTSTASFGSRVSGGVQETMPRGTAVASTGAIAFTGQFSGTVNFGTGPLAAHGQTDLDAFIVLVDPPAQ